jgi:thiol-disulfide isomerase/thioredoxin
MSSRLEKASNIALIVSAVVFLGVTIRNEFAKPAVRANSSVAIREALIGKTLHPPGMTFPRERQTVLLAVSSSCHFCQESWPFFRELAARSEGKLDVVAVLPQSQSEAESYVKEAKVPVAKVVSANLQSMGVAVTPTVILLDRGGKVRDVWVGQLDEGHRKQALSRVFSN